MTFLDPVTKSAVFLREITSRLTQGLKDQIPDLKERVDHVLTEQVFGIGITRLTTYMACRSVYCSKDAASGHSDAQSFRKAKNSDGNIWFERTEQTWVGGTEWVLTPDKHGNQVAKFTNGKCNQSDQQLPGPPGAQQVLGQIRRDVALGDAVVVTGSFAAVRLAPVAAPALLTLYEQRSRCARRAARSSSCRRRQQCRSPEALRPGRLGSHLD